MGEGGESGEMRGEVGERDGGGRGRRRERRTETIQSARTKDQLGRKDCLFLRRERGDRERQRHRDKHRATEMHKQAHAQKQWNIGFFSIRKWRMKDDGW